MMTLARGTQKKSRDNTRAPKSFVFKLISGLQKKFDPQAGKPMYVLEKTIGKDENGKATVETFRWETLQEVVDANFPFFPQLRKFATIAAIQEHAAKLKNEPVQGGVRTNQYWQCNCQEDFVQPWTQLECNVCGGERDSCELAELDDVIALGCAMDWPAHEAWLKEQETHEREAAPLE